MCAEAGDGMEAVELTMQLKPDLILLDLSMPEMNGLDAARRISAIVPRIPVLMPTAYACPQLEIEATKLLKFPHIHAF